MKKQNQDKVKHHTVPREYLRGFTDPSDREAIFVYRPGAKPFQTGVAGVGFEKHFYTVERDDGTKDSNLVEDALANRVENPANGILAKIRRKESLTSQDKETLSQY